jgi:hypothetical protein
MFIVALMIGLRHSLNLDLLAFIAASTLLLLADSRAMVWMAIWTGMSNPKQRNAGVAASVLITLIPWILVSVCYSSTIVISGHWVWILWPTFALANDLVISRLAQNRLRKYFRLWAVPSYAEVPGFWARQGRRLGLLKRRVSTGQSPEKI